MNRDALARLLMPLALIFAPAAAQARDVSLRVMTYNIRLPIAADGINAWDKRRDVAAAMVARVAPDIIGTQELHKEQGDYLVAKLPGYAWFGIDRRGGHGDEHMGLFYRKDRLKLVQSGNFWLSETPDVPGSISWGHPYPRMATWGLFETVKGHHRFYAFDTHLPYRAEDEPARLKAVAVLLDRMRAIAGKAPVVLTGDFNTTPDSPVHAALTRSLVDARETAARRMGPDKTFHNYTGNPDRRIDWILTRGFRTTQVETVTDHRGPVQTSDHYPVVAELSWR